MNTKTAYTVQELVELIVANREQTRRADRMGLRDIARNCRYERRRLEALYAEAVSA